jgi:hypothetical protein
MRGGISRAEAIALLVLLTYTFACGFFLPHQKALEQGIYVGAGLAFLLVGALHAFGLLPKQLLYSTYVFSVMVGMFLALAYTGLSKQSEWIVVLIVGGGLAYLAFVEVPKFVPEGPKPQPQELHPPMLRTPQPGDLPIRDSLKRAPTHTDPFSYP